MEAASSSHSTRQWKYGWFTNGGGPRAGTGRQWKGRMTGVMALGGGGVLCFPHLDQSVPTLREQLWEWKVTLGEKHGRPQSPSPGFIFVHPSAGFLNQGLS